MKLSRELIPIAFILLVLLAIGIFHRGIVPKPSPQKDMVEHTSYSTKKQGTKALYLLLKELGYMPRRLRTPFAGMSADGLAVILVPDGPPVDREDADRLLEWLRRGNTLVFAPGEHEDQIAESLGIEVHQGRPLGVSIAPLTPTTLNAGIGRLVIRSGRRILTEKANAVQHFGDSSGGVVISLPEGTGTAIVISDPHLMTNAGLPEGDNLRLLVNILFSFANDNKTVYFDEYHHGFERQPTILHLLKGTSLSWALLQAALAIILLLYSRSRRFGRPKPVFSETHRSSVEYVTSLAGIYEAAQASVLALSNLYERLARSAVGRRPSESIVELMDECRRKIRDGKIGDRELIELSRRIESALHPEGGR